VTTDEARLVTEARALSNTFRRRAEAMDHRELVAAAYRRARRALDDVRAMLGDERVCQTCMGYGRVVFAATPAPRKSEPCPECGGVR